MVRFPFESLVETLSDLWPMADFPEDWIILADLDILRDLRMFDRKKWLKRGKAEVLRRAIQARVDEIAEAVENEDLGLVNILTNAFPDDLQHFEDLRDDQKKEWISRALVVADGIFDVEDDGSKVYFVGDSEFIKIGVTTNLSARLRSFRTSSPRPIRIYLTLPGFSDDERIYHERFAKYRVEGEWFRHNGALRKFLEGVTLQRLQL